ncbi:hypothetical protein G6R29_02800 [Fructobacillus sp. M2-14]|uniref:Uncharacterized protein n=1 Tax=Fructobacillus broussonetiae TaxID=2713173 RepID=A0ABS5R329_9LACO|nr:hypothetical protein [Fructobacillus broussonetiae]MBS9338562.1 hypothetical protein [Fructobacillus broussonetiae]
MEKFMGMIPIERNAMPDFWDWFDTLVRWGNLAIKLDRIMKMLLSLHDKN